MYTDPIADYLTRIRNAMMANHDKVAIPASKIKENITKVLIEKGYLKSFELVDVENKKLGGRKHLLIHLKYINDFGSKRIYSINELQRVSKPGLRKYYKLSEVPHILNGLGIAILSTSKGVISDKEARTMKVGGEILCYVH